MRHVGEGVVVDGLQSVLVEHEDVDLPTLGERVCVECGEVVATQLHVAQRRRQAARHTPQSALGHVDVRQRRRAVEVQAVDVDERVAAQHEVQQLRQVTQCTPVHAIDAVVVQEQIAQFGQAAERELGECRQVVAPQVQSARSIHSVASVRWLIERGGAVAPRKQATGTKQPDQKYSMTKRKTDYDKVF